MRSSPKGWLVALASACVVAVLLTPAGSSTSADRWVEIYRSPFEHAGFAIDARTVDDIWLAGGRLLDGRVRTFTVHFDGQGWRIVHTPQPSDADWTFNDVESLGPRKAWVVGVGMRGALSLRWDGTAWRRVKTPWRARQLLAADRIPGRRMLYAVGYARPHGAIILKWTGRGWREQRLPAKAARYGGLVAVDAVSRQLAWAVGDVGGTSLILRHSKRGWHRVRPPELRGVDLRGVAALSRERAFVLAGSRGLLRWNGEDWRSVPRFWASSVRLAAIAAGGNSVWVTGTRVAGGSPADIRPFAMRWRKGRWQIVPVANVAQEFYHVSLAGSCVFTVGSLSEGMTDSAVFRRCGD